MIRTIHNIQDMEILYMAINRGMNKEDVGWGDGGSLTMSHRVQLQRLGHGHPQTRHRGLPYLGLEERVHHGGLSQPALSCE